MAQTVRIVIPPDKLAAGLVKYFLSGVIERVEKEKNIEPVTREATGSE